MAESFDIDKAEQDYNDARAAVEDEAPADDPDDDQEEAAPPGFLSFEEYVEQGGDPDMYRGRKAYETEHERIEENKRLRRDVKGLQSTVRETMDAVKDWQSTERGKMRAELEAELHKAKEDEDLDGALETQKKLDRLDEQPAPEARPPEHPVIQDFREANPVLDEESETFDEEFNLSVEAFYNALRDQLSYGGRRALTDGQIKRCLRKAMKDAIELHGDEAPTSATPQRRAAAEDENAADPGESPRNTRRAAGANRRRASREPAKPRAEDFVLDNPMNPNQKNAAPDVRDRIHRAALEGAKKAGLSDADAKKRADEHAERFEASLTR